MQRVETGRSGTGASAVSVWGWSVAPGWMVALVASTGVTLALTAAGILHRQEDRRIQAEFQHRAEQHFTALEQHIRQAADALFPLRLLFEHSEEVTLSEFRAASTELLVRQAELQRVEWMPRVPAAERAGFETEAQRSVWPEFQIRDRLGSGRIVSAGQRLEYYPLLYAEPFRPEASALGWDAGVGPDAPEILRARDTGTVRSTWPPAEGGQLLWAVIQPVYRTNIAQAAPFRGCLRAVFRFEALLERSLAASHDGGLNTRVFEKTGSGTRRLVGVHDGSVPRAAVRAGDKTIAPGAFTRDFALSFAGRDWEFQVQASPAWMVRHRSWSPMLLLLWGVAATALFTAYLLASFRRAGQVESVVAERTSSLFLANELLQREISERRRAEEALRKAQRSLVEAQRIGHIGSWESDLDAHTITWSDEAYRIFGRTPEEFAPTRENFYQCVHPDDRARVQAASENAVRHGTPYEVEHRVLRPDGSEHIVLEKAEVVRAGEGHPVRLIGTVEDITERKQAELALRESERRFRELFENSPEAILVADLSGKILDVNPAAGRLHGGRREELQGRLWAEWVRSDQREEAARELSNITPEGHAEFESVTCAAAGRAVPIGVRVSVITVAGERALLLHMRDLTRLKEAESQRLMVERKLQEAQKLESLGLVAGGIAHDFNNLLTGILGNASLARAELPRGASTDPLLENIERAALRAADLCKQMLAYAGKGRFVVGLVDLNELVHETTHLLGSAISKAAALRFDLAARVPPVNADASQLSQVIMNLVINASEALGKGGGVISIRTGVVRADHAYLAGAHLAPELPAGSYVFLEVSDNGCGMSPETLGKIFDPFFTTKFTGRGLGLAAVLGIVRSHKGAVKVYSEPGRGSTFKMLLPATTGSATERLAAIAAAPAWRGSGTVLVVDDEDSVRAVTARMVAVAGFQVVEAADGQQALERYRELNGAVAVVLLDLTMPHLSGEATFCELRRLNPKVRVILMSGFNEQDAVNSFAGKGLAGFLQKPFKPDDLREKLCAVLS